jgi:WD40 repeat protein
VADAGRCFLASVSFDVVAWDAKSRQVVRAFPSPSGIVTSLAISPDGKSLVFGTAGKRLVCCDFKSGQERWQVEGKTSFSATVAITPDGRACVTGGNDKSVRLWDLATGHEIRVIGHHEGYVQGLAFVPGGDYLLTASRDKSLRLWDIHRPKLLDGRTAVSAGGDGVRVWDLASQTQVASFMVHGKSVSCLAIASENRRAASGGQDGCIRLWELP